MQSIYLSPAKLNLFLHIVGQRADGYHELQTIFQLLNYCDELTFEVHEDNDIRLTTKLDPTLTNKNIGDTDNNLITRAASLLQKISGTKMGAAIQLYKRIPIGGGLGGGSSNAATTLLALNQLWQINLPQEELLKLATQLGADVPMFVQGKTAWAEGIGEKLTPITLNENWFVIVIPPCAIPTVEIYSTNELTRNTPPITIQQFFAGHATHNDCEAVVRNRYPLVATALDWLNQFAPARLTGTGACVFAAFTEEQDARAVAQQIPAPLQGFVAKGINIFK